MMRARQKTEVGVALAIVGGLAIAAIITFLPRYLQTTSITGAVIANSADPRKQTPIAGAEISATSGFAKGFGRSDSQGYFRLTFHPSLVAAQSVSLKVVHPDFLSIETTEPPGDRVYVIRMTPADSTVPDNLNPGETLISDIRVRYTVKVAATVNVGSISKTFEVANIGNVVCDGRQPCSPDGKWKASTGAVSIDAGEGNELREVRVSCIAGPCPFTKLEPSVVSRNGRVLKVTAQNWSDTVTFLVEADVTRTRANETVRQSYPVAFGQTMTFTLPPTAQGASIEAEFDGSGIVFPLGPQLNLSWAVCSLKVDAHQGKLYRCELKPGYRFK
jgi:hypothetical protein